MKKIGILGGTFDPIHNGHIEMAKRAFKQYNLEQIWFMPAPNPPHKTNSIISDYSIRADMVKLALADLDYCICSDFELTLAGKSYTARTISELKLHYPDFDFALIIGGDSFFQIESWYHPEEVLKNADVLVAARKFDSGNETYETKANRLKEIYGAHINYIDFNEIDISSTEIRMRIKQHKSISELVNNSVEKYIYENKLYEKE